MRGKRRDKKNRILRTGETQEKDGRYRYRYTDSWGQRRSVYSWRLVETDVLPAGQYVQKYSDPLRNLEQKIMLDLDACPFPNGGYVTVYQLVKRYTSLRTGVKRTTRAGYGTVLKLLEDDPFGARRIDKVKILDAKAWLIKLQQEDGKSYTSIHTVRGVLRPAFQMALEDDLVRKNPFEFHISSVLENDTCSREALTKRQEEIQ